MKKTPFALAALAAVVGAMLAGACGGGSGGALPASDAQAPSSPLEWSRVDGIDAPVSIAIAPNDFQTPFAIYVGTAGGGVFHSQDGVAWEATGPRSVVSVAPMPQVTVAFASLPDGSVELTKDTGATWAATSASPGAVIHGWIGIAGVGPLGATSDAAGNARVVRGESVGATWISSDAFGPGVASALAFGGGTSPSITVYAAVRGSGGGVYKSTNVGGASFSFASTRFPHDQVLSVATAPSSVSTVFAGTNGQGAGIYVSKDGGETWSPSGAGLGNTVVQAIAVDPTNAENVYAGTDAGVYVSRNGGSSWVAGGLASSSVASLAILNGSPTTVYAATTAGLYVTPPRASFDAGTPAVDANGADAPDDASAVDAVADTTVDATPADAPVNDGASSADAGADSPADAPADALPDASADAPADAAGSAWSSVAAVTAPVSIAIAPNTGATPYAIYVGTSGAGVFYSTDGVGWASSGPSSVVALAPMPQAKVAFASLPDGTAELTQDTGATWAPTSASPDTLIRAWTAIAGVGPLGATSDGSGNALVVQGKSSGASWVSSSAFGPGVATSLAFGGGSSPAITVYAAVDGSGGGVYKSTNVGAASFTFAATSFPYEHVLSVATAPSSLATVFAGTNGQGAGIYVSTDGGATWSPSGNGLGNTVVQTLAVDPTDAQNVYAGTASGVYVSKDGGASWTASGLGSSSVTSLAVLNGAPSTVYAATSTGLYVSTSGGL